MIKNELNISLVKPSNGEEGVSLDAPISVLFTKDLNKGTILKNFLVIKDVNKNIETIEDIQTKPYEVITGGIEYKNKEIVFKPNENLDLDSKYLIIVRKHIASIMTEYLFRDYMFSFYTKTKIQNTITEPTPVITYPKDLSIINKLQSIEWESSSKNGFIVQLSTSQNFNEISFKYESMDNEKSCVIDRKLDDGNYYIRVKSLDSEWSEISQVYLQNTSSSPINEADNYVNDIDSLLHELNIETNFEYEVELYGNSKRYVLNNNRFLFTINDHVTPSEFEITLTKIRDIVEDEEVSKELNIASKTFLYNYQENKTFVVVEIDGR